MKPRCFSCALRTAIRFVGRAAAGMLSLIIPACAIVLCIGWPNSGRAEDGITNVIDGFITNVTGQVIVGNTGCRNALIITNGGVLACAEAIIGNADTARENLALIIGKGSAWYQTNTLWVGCAGINNSLVVAGGGIVTNTVCCVTRRNTVLVTDPDSRFTSGTLVIEGGRVSVTNCGTLETGQVVGSATFDHVEVVVAGYGTMWLNMGNFELGHSSNSNVMRVLDGGVITNAGKVYIGHSSLGIGEYCSATIAGPGTRWLTADDLYIGEDGSFNTLAVSNGARVENNTGLIGLHGTRHNNATITGQNSAWINRSDLYVGKGGSDCSLVVTDGATVSNVTGYIGLETTARSNRVFLAGSGSLWVNASNLYVGHEGDGNLLTVSQGARVECQDCYVGYGAYSSKNSVEVEGPGSMLACTGMLNIGNWYMENSLLVRNGATVTCKVAHIGSGGNQFIPMYNRAEITGPGAKLESRTSIFIGSVASSFNELTVGPGGYVKSERLVIGVDQDSMPNHVAVHGGTVIVTNSAGLGSIDVRYGWLYLWDGTVLTDLLFCTNGGLTFSGGQLATKGGWFTQYPLVVGDGVRQAQFLARGGNYVFAHGLVLTNNAELCGAGAFYGDITNAGVIRPGSPIGLVTVSRKVILHPSSILEFELGGPQTNQYDRMLISGRLSANGTLVVKLADGFRPQPGDSFRVLQFGSIDGAFASISLPAGYLWEDRLLIDGTITVTGVCQVRFDPPQRQGTNLLLSGMGGPPGAPFFLLTSTNITVPLANWVVISTNSFETNGRFALTVPIDPAAPRRFFTIAY